MEPATNTAIDVYGFKAFCKYLLETSPGYFVSPLRISGSAVVSLFSHHSGFGYRDQMNTPGATFKGTLPPIIWKLI